MTRTILSVWWNLLGASVLCAVLGAVGLLGIGVAADTAEGAVPPVLRPSFCLTGSDAGQCSISRGIAVDAASGNVYVVNQNNQRIEEFDAWGEFRRAWGWGVEDGAPELQTCTTNCLVGVIGGDGGQFGNGPQGITVDSNGDVYVVDWGNRRVQKFDPSEAEVKFVLTVGGNVNKTKTDGGGTEAERNLCTATSGDTCQAGVEGTGSGQFGAWAVGSFIASSPDGETIYVGDEKRIQEFDTEGHYIGDLPDPEGVIEEGTVQSLAADPVTGELYVGRNGKNDVLKLDLAGSNACPGGGALKVERPSAIAAGVHGDVYVVSARKGGSPPITMKVIQFDSECIETNRFDAEDEGFINSTGIATSPPKVLSDPTCGLTGTDLFVGNSSGSNSFVRIYGPPSDPATCPPPEVPPVVLDQYALSVGSNGATVRATINPRFWPDAQYFVQYGTGECSAGGCEEEQPVAPGRLLTEAVINAPITSAGIFLDNLLPATTYHYRFVVKSGGGGPVFGVGGTESEPEGEEATFTTFPLPSDPKVGCSNQTFRTGLSAPLPDCRAYELVSPLDKNNGDIATDEARLAFDPANFQLVSPDGNRATYSSFRSFGSPESAPLFSQFLSSREDEVGWATHSISPPRSSLAFYPPLSFANMSQFKVFSEDLCQALFIQDSSLVLVPGAPSNAANIYRRDDGDCGEEGFELVTPESPPGFGENAEVGNSRYFPEVQGLSSDSTNALIRANAVLTSNACHTTPKTEESKGIFQLYLHESTEVGDGQLHLVSVLPNGNAACVHSSAGTAQGLLGDFRKDSVYHALSDDGSRVFWSTSGSSTNTDPTGGGGDQAGPLYLRLNPTEAQSPLSAGKCTEPALACTYKVSELVAPTQARFWTANPEGTSALFSLDPDGPGSESQNLYRFETEDDEGKVVTKAALVSKGFLGLMGTSEDLSRAYFVSTEVLTGEEPNGLGDKAIAGQPNLYVEEKGTGPVFIGTLSNLDVRNKADHNELLSSIASIPDKRTSRVTPDGLHATFLSAASLTNYDNTDAVGGEPDAEVFLYDTAGGGDLGELTCISCNPTGARPQGRLIRVINSPPTKVWHAARIPGWASQLYASRVLSDHGNRLFFESYESLVLRDTNGKRDVYEWERAGSEEECTKDQGGELYVESARGCISLISSGQSSEDSDFFDASASGSDVFFATASSLLPQDFGLVDVYDAREKGGFPPPEPPEPPCEGEACQPSPAPPESPTPASSAIEGDGNVKPGPPRKPCGKGRRRVARDGKARCVKKHKRNRKRSASNRDAGKRAVR